MRIRLFVPSSAAIAAAAIFLCAPAVFAQDQAAAARAAAGCGPSQVQFDVKVDETLHMLAQPEAGKAIVYVVEDYIGGPTMRVGVDGSWAGATNGRSYLYISLTPGDHNVCAEWQSNVFKKTSERVGVARTLSVEAVKIYYLRITFIEIEKASGRINLELTDNAEGQFLISSSALSNSHPKK
jgi:hypothetical protein